MACASYLCTLVFAVAFISGPRHAAAARFATSQARTRAAAADTPVTRVVNLLKEMQKALTKEMEEDEALYDKLSCWCNNNEYEKQGAAEASQTKISGLEASIEGLSAKSTQLKTTIEELEAEVASNKKVLAEATALREKQRKDAHGNELDSIQAVENLKAAIEVLSKHHGAPPESSVAGGPIFKTTKDSWESLLAVKSVVTQGEGSWTQQHEASHIARPLEEFLRRSGLDDTVAVPTSSASAGFLQGEDSAAGAVDAAGWSSEDKAIVSRALRSASAFMQTRHEESYYPAYNSQSGEIMGVLKQLKEEMEGDLSEAQKLEAQQAASFEELRSAKVAEIEHGEKTSEQKEDALAATANALAEAKEDLGQEQASLSETQKFLVGLKETCATASKDFEARKAMRMKEIQAVSETVEILTADEARDAMSGTYNLLQRATARAGRSSERRQRAATMLRTLARTVRDPQLSLMATSVELDAFTKVKAAIDKMISMLKVQQEDEVKKSDYCKSEIHENEMTTEKKEDHKGDLEAKEAQLASNIKALEDGIAAARAQVAQLQLDLQRASEDRKAENLEFQKTVQDQTLTIEVLKSALQRLAVFYKRDEDKKAAALLQDSGYSAQTPPVPQMKYKPSKAAAGVMEMIEKLVLDAHSMLDESRKSETNSQVAYEQIVADTNASVMALQKEVSTKSKAKAHAEKAKRQVESDITDTTSELEDLAKLNSDLHADCDYTLKNFATRQEARSQEIEALQQAKQILSGASFDS